jgi:hypothetical protein
MTKEEKKERNKKWRLKHLEEKREYDRKYYYEHRDEILTYGREWNKNNKEHVHRYNKEYFNKHYQKIKKLKEKLGNHCLFCGFSKEPKILHFHHLRDKKFSINRMIKLPIEEIKKEVDKCVLLCPNCHAIEHLKK